MTRALILSGGGAYSDPWHPFAETSAALAGLVAAIASLDSSADQLTALAVDLTVAGALVTISSLVHEERRVLAWPGGALLAAATWVRFGLPKLPPAATSEASAVRQSWQVTVRLLRDPRVRGLLLIQWLPPSFVTGAEALVVPYAAERSFPAGTAGLMLAFVPVGMLAGNIAMGRLVRPDTRERLVSAILVVFGLPLAAQLSLVDTANLVDC